MNVYANFRFKKHVSVVCVYGRCLSVCFSYACVCVCNEIEIEGEIKRKKYILATDGTTGKSNGNSRWRNWKCVFNNDPPKRVQKFEHCKTKLNATT